MTNQITLVSTVVAPKFGNGRLELTAVDREYLLTLLPCVTRNLCGHPVTDTVLRQECPTLPEPERAFWNGEGLALAVRPRGGVRGARQEGDTAVTLEDVEAVLFRWEAV
jgi:hypothetical protein